MSRVWFSLLFALSGISTLFTVGYTIAQGITELLPMAAVPIMLGLGIGYLWHIGALDDYDDTPS